MTSLCALLVLRVNAISATSARNDAVRLDYHRVTGGSRLKILVVDDHPLLHETLGAVARNVVPEAEIHAETSLMGAVEYARELGEDLELVLLDLGLPGCTGIEALTRVRAAAPTVRIVVISANEDPATVEAAIQAGAAGYIPKTTMPQQMIAALRLILSGGVYLPMQVMEATQPGTVTRPRKPPTMAELGLTGRQVDVMRLLLKGLAYRDIGRQLKISESTVKQHCHALYRTLGVNSRTEAFIALARKGIKLD